MRWSRYNPSAVYHLPRDRSCLTGLSLAGQRERKRIMNEVSLLRTLSHPHLISFYGAWVNKEHEKVVFVTELMSSGTLKEFTAKYPIPLKQIKRYCREILECINYLHTPDDTSAQAAGGSGSSREDADGTRQQGDAAAGGGGGATPAPAANANPKKTVIHRDLKCDNIFIMNQGKGIKIGDLGLATTDGRSVLGTPEFMAPEMYEPGYGSSVDIYAFGLCLLEMITAKTPYIECSGVVQIYKRVLAGILPENVRVLEAGWPEAYAFLQRCLVPMPPADVAPNSRSRAAAGGDVDDADEEDEESSAAVASSSDDPSTAAPLASSAGTGTQVAPVEAALGSGTGSASAADASIPPGPRVGAASVVADGVTATSPSGAETPVLPPSSPTTTTTAGVAASLAAAAPALSSSTAASSRVAGHTTTAAAASSAVSGQGLSTASNLSAVSRASARSGGSVATDAGSSNNSGKRGPVVRRPTAAELLLDPFLLPDPEDSARTTADVRRAAEAKGFFVINGADDPHRRTDLPPLHLPTPEQILEAAAQRAADKAGAVAAAAHSAGSAAPAAALPAPAPPSSDAGSSSGSTDSPTSAVAAAMDAPLAPATAAQHGVNLPSVAPVGADDVLQHTRQQQEHELSAGPAAAAAVSSGAVESQAVLQAAPADARSQEPSSTSVGQQAVLYLGQAVAGTAVALDSLQSQLQRALVPVAAAVAPVSAASVPPALIARSGGGGGTPRPRDGARRPPGSQAAPSSSSSPSAASLDGAPATAASVVALSDEVRALRRTMMQTQAMVQWLVARTDEGRAFLAKGAAPMPGQGDGSARAAGTGPRSSSLTNGIAGSGRGDRARSSSGSATASSSSAAVVPHRPSLNLEVQPQSNVQAPARVHFDAAGDAPSDGGGGGAPDAGVGVQRARGRAESSTQQQEQQQAAARPGAGVEAEPAEGVLAGPTRPLPKERKARVKSVSFADMTLVPPATEGPPASSTAGVGEEAVSLPGTAAAAVSNPGPAFAAAGDAAAAQQHNDVVSNRVTVVADPIDERVSPPHLSIHAGAGGGQPSQLSPPPTVILTGEGFAAPSANGSPSTAAAASPRQHLQQSSPQGQASTPPSALESVAAELTAASGASASGGAHRRLPSSSSLDDGLLILGGGGGGGDMLEAGGHLEWEPPVTDITDVDAASGEPVPEDLQLEINKLRTDRMLQESKMAKLAWKALAEVLEGKAKSEEEHREAVAGEHQRHADETGRLEKSRAEILKVLVPLRQKRDRGKSDVGDVAAEDDKEAGAGDEPLTIRERTEEQLYSRRLELLEGREADEHRNHIESLRQAEEGFESRCRRFADRERAIRKDFADKILKGRAELEAKVQELKLALRPQAVTLPPNSPEAAQSAIGLDLAAAGARQSTPEHQIRKLPISLHLDVQGVAAPTPPSLVFVGLNAPRANIDDSHRPAWNNHANGNADADATVAHPAVASPAGDSERTELVT